MRSHLLVVTLVGLLVSACASAPDAAVDVPSRVGFFLAEARAVEPSVTALLTEITDRRGGDLAGREHRFKTRASLERKIAGMLRDDPALAPDEMVIDDALRYTVRVEDEPAGHHVRVIREVLAALVGRGHRVLEVKNYWPGGDSYSGVNSILRAPGGLLFELQFHTAASFAVKSQTHARYEAYRRPETSAAEKRRLFAEMAAPWFSVPIPAGILRDGALHSQDQIILRRWSNGPQCGPAAMEGRPPGDRAGSPAASRRICERCEDCERQ